MHHHHTFGHNWPLYWDKLQFATVSIQQQTCNHLSRFLNTINHLEPTYIGQKTGLGSSCGLKAGILLSTPLLIKVNEHVDFNSIRLGSKNHFSCWNLFPLQAKSHMDWCFRNANSHSPSQVWSLLLSHDIFSSREFLGRFSTPRLTFLRFGCLAELGGLSQPLSQHPVFLLQPLLSLHFSTVCTRPASLVRQSGSMDHYENDWWWCYGWYLYSKTAKHGKEGSLSGTKPSSIMEATHQL